jgi:hypothetical protein
VLTCQSYPDTETARVDYDSRPAGQERGETFPVG